MHRERSDPHRSQHHRTSRHRRIENEKRHGKRQRTASPHRESSRSLPFNAKALDKHEFKTYRTLLSSYLDVQKQKDMEDMSEQEIRGRWKSFVGKWNQGILAEGWYDPDLLLRIRQSAYDERKAKQHFQEAEEIPPDNERFVSLDYAFSQSNASDELGPCLPSELQESLRDRRSGACAPNIEDLDVRQELAQDVAEAERIERQSRKRQERRIERDRLEELAPRADAGTRERALEKKQERAQTNKAFALRKTDDGGGIPEFQECDLYGAGDANDPTSIAHLKQQQQWQERKKNERELRKEALLRERAEERQERLRIYHEKEANTMSGLVALAKARFG